MLSKREPKISNVKGHFRLPSSILARFQQKLRHKRTVRFGNYVSLKERYAYIIFPQNGFVNVTGIKSLKEVSLVVNNFFYDFELDLRFVARTHFVVDSTTATGDFNCRLDLVLLQKYVNSHSDCGLRITYNRDRFSGAACRSNIGPCAIIFASGKFNLLGSKNRWQIRNVVLQLNAVMSNLSTMRGKEKQYVSAADSSWNSFMRRASVTDKKHFTSRMR